MDDDGLEQFLERAKIREPFKTQYLVKLREENIGMDVLSYFSQDELQSLGFRAGDVKRILLLADEMKEEELERAGPSTTGSTLSERLSILEKKFSVLHLDHSLVVLRDGIWRFNKKFGRKQYENTPPSVEKPSHEKMAKESPNKQKKSPKKSSEKSPKKGTAANLSSQNYALDDTMKTINKKYCLKDGDFLNFLDCANQAGTNVTHNNKKGSTSPLKRAYKAIIEEGTEIKKKRPTFFNDKYIDEIKMPSIDKYVMMERPFFR